MPRQTPKEFARSIVRDLLAYDVPGLMRSQELELIFEGLIAARDAEIAEAAARRVESYACRDLECGAKECMRLREAANEIRTLARP